MALAPDQEATMRLDDQRQSDNYERRSGQRGRGGGGLGGLRFGSGGLGIGGIIIIGLVMLFFPPARQLLPILLNQGGTGVGTQQSGSPGDPLDSQDVFLRKVLASTEDVWSEAFSKGAMVHYGYQGKQYSPPLLVRFDSQTPTQCGTGTAAVGPFYCPSDKQVYIDTDFFDLMSERFGAAGDFAQAYVVAHEVAHHVQTLIGVSDQVQQMKARGGERETNALQVRMELQADCFAGIWGKKFAEQRTASGQPRLETGDFDEAMVAANAIGDDTLQRQARGYVQPDTFTHGTSEQRKKWFRQGFETGDPAQCDTFNAPSL
jgi:uncharacterized protein